MTKFGEFVFEKIWPVSLKLGLILGFLGFVFGIIIGIIVDEGFFHCLRVGSFFGAICLFSPILAAKALSILYALVFIFSQAFMPLMRWAFREFLKK